jgi:holin-like protein
MIAALALLLGFQLAGEVIRLALGLPVPGPVIGMVLLLAVLILRGGPSPNLRSTSGGLLQHLSLLFVPAGTGVMLHAQRLGEEGPAILVALVASTFLGLAVAALTLHLLTRRKGMGGEP